MEVYFYLHGVTILFLCLPAMLVWLTRDHDNNIQKIVCTNNINNNIAWLYMASIVNKCKQIENPTISFQSSKYNHDEVIRPLTGALDSFMQNFDIIGH